MKNRTFFTTAALLALAAPTWAAGFAVVDAQSVMRSANATKSAEVTLTKQREAIIAKVTALQAPLEAKRKELGEQAAVMSADKRAAAEDAFRKDFVAMRTQIQTLQEDFDKQAVAANKRITDAIKLSVAEIAKEKGYDMVLPKGGVHYSAPSVPDITAETLARTNAKLPN